MTERSIGGSHVEGARIGTLMLQTTVVKGNRVLLIIITR